MDKRVFEKATAQLDSVLANPLDERGRSYFIEKPVHGRRLVLTDIHGCYQTFSKLLGKLDLQKEDQLFILGDMIDRGPYSFLVLQKIAELIGAGFRVFPLRGNHEQLYLNFNRENPVKLLTFAQRQYSAHLLDGAGLLLKPVEAFFDRLPYYYETDNAFMVHAGFNTGKKNPFEAWKDMIWIRDFEYRKKKLCRKLVIHGHVPVKIDNLKSNLKAGKRKVNLDNGCVRGEIAGYGNLVCLDLDTGKLITQKNKDIQLA